MTTVSNAEIPAPQTRVERMIEAGLPLAGPAAAFVLMVAAACGVAAGA